MNQSTEQKRWSLILADPQSPAELQADARARLGIKADPSPQLLRAYRASLDSFVESFWGVRCEDWERRDAVAEAVYSILVRWLLLGGIPELADSDAANLLEILGICRSHWMRYRVARSLLTIRLRHKESITSETCHAIESALNALDFDYTKAEQWDWLELLRVAKHETTTETANTI